MTPDDRGAAILGGFDGTASLLGLVAGWAIINAAQPDILRQAVGFAVASAVSMGAGQYLALTGRRRLERAGVMGVATLVGAALPAVPLVMLRGWPAYGVCAAVTLGLGVLVAWLRPDRAGLRAYALTLGILVVAAAFAVGAALLVGVAG